MWVLIIPHMNTAVIAGDNMDIKHNVPMQAQLMLLMLMLHAQEHNNVWFCLILSLNKMIHRGEMSWKCVK